MPPSDQRPRGPFAFQPPPGNTIKTTFTVDLPAVSSLDMDVTPLIDCETRKCAGLVMIDVTMAAETRRGMAVVLRHIADQIEFNARWPEANDFVVGLPSGAVFKVPGEKPEGA